MVNAQDQKNSGGESKRRRPRERGVAGVPGQPAGKINQPALRGNFSDVEKYAAKADEERLLALRRRQHVKAIGGYVVGGRTECQQSKKDDCPLDKMRRGNHQGHTGQAKAEQQLHRPNPHPPGFENIHGRTPQGFDDPGQIEPAGVKRDGRVRHAEVVVEHDRHRCHQRIRHSLGKIHRGNPKPRAAGAGFCVGHPPLSNRLKPSGQKISGLRFGCGPR